MGLDPSRAKQETEGRNFCGSHSSPGSPLQRTLRTSAKHLPAHPELPYQSHCVEEDPSKGGQLVQDPQVLQLRLGCGDLTKHITQVITTSTKGKKCKRLAKTWGLASRGTAREEPRRLMYNPPEGCITLPGSSDGYRDPGSGSAASSRAFQAQKQR